MITQKYRYLVPRVAVAVFACVGLAVAACSSTEIQPPNLPAPKAPHLTAKQLGLVPANPALTDRVVLHSTRVRAGQPLVGTLLVTNHSSHSINLKMGICVRDWALGLAGRGITIYPGFVASCSGEPLLVGPGLHRYPLSVLATYGVCTEVPRLQTRSLPPCVNNAAPNLPPGTYYALLFGSGNLPLPEPRPIAVTVVPLSP